MCDININTNINTDVATVIAGYIVDLDTLCAWAMTSRATNAAVRYLIRTQSGRGTSKTDITVCGRSGAVNRCTSGRDKSNRCVRMHVRPRIDVAQLSIHCTIGQFFAEILPHTTWAQYPTSPYAQFVADQCAVCNRLCRYGRRVVIDIGARVATVQNRRICQGCRITAPDVVIRGTTIITTVPYRTPRHANLALYKAFKKANYTHRRSVYNFVFI